MEFEDYTAYSNLSDEELIQLAIERSLAEEVLASSYIPPPPEAPKTSYPSSSPSPNPRPSFKHDVFTTMEIMIHDHDEEALLAFVKENAGCSMATNGDGWTALHEAAYFGELGCLMILIETFPDMVNRCSPMNQTALLLAAYRGQVSCVEYLLEHGADPNICNKKRESPLFRACENKSQRMVELLLRSGASVNKTDNQGATPFHEAVKNDHLEVCEILFQAGAKISTFNIYGNRPFFTAAQSGCANVLAFLLAKGADINKQARDGATPLYEACKNDHLSTVEILLSHKADVNLPTKSGLLPIHQATQRANKQVVSMLLPLTSKERVSDSGISPLHLAAEDGLDDILELLIQDGYDVNSQLSKEHRLMYEDHRSTVLYFSVYDNNLEAATILLEAGADPNLDFFNPLLMAVQKGNFELVELLLMYGADVNASLATHKLGFPSAVLLGMNTINVLKLLLDHGCDAQHCFDCDYGCKAHPHFTPLWERQQLQYRRESPTEQSVDFCEAISKYCNKEPGPIISLLLDYVGHIKLCSRLLEILDGCSDGSHIKLKAVPPHPLMQLCRLRIRKILGAKRMKTLNALPLPNRLLCFLWYDVESLSQ